MNNFYVLSIDQSTQGTKAVILNDSGIIQARHDLPHKQIINENGWVSHDPEEIYENVIKTVKMVVEKAGIDKTGFFAWNFKPERDNSRMGQENRQPLAMQLFGNATEQKIFVKE